MIADGHRYGIYKSDNALHLPGTIEVPTQMCSIDRIRVKVRK